MLARGAPRGDTIARLGGDEFVVLSTTAQTRGQARALAGTIHASLDGMRQVSGNAVTISASIGICMLDGANTRDDNDVRSVMKQADRAMYLAKELGKKRTAFADELAQNDANMNQPPRARSAVLRHRG
jgi:diguanylate cyclase (GGDEF)-like protein